jgi:beta-N-acetylhexosaminidase
MIMVGHISLPNVTGDGTPASLSPVVITGLLREELGFDGVVITDSLSMGAITQDYPSGRAAVLAVKAGADMLLIPEDITTAFQALLKSVKSGEIPESRIDASVARILALKKKYHLFTPRQPGDVSLLGSEEHSAILRQIG